MLEQADEGTVFLDEVAETVPTYQAKLLRFLEEKAFRRLGSTSDIKVDVRVIAATNQDLEKTVRDGKFREDLYYRLNVLRIEMPPLRQRDRDIVLLAEHYIKAFSQEFRRPVRRLSAAAEQALLAYSWPGNVRELRNLIERAVLLAESEDLEPADFETAHTLRSPVETAIGRGIELPEAGLDIEEVEKKLSCCARAHAAIDARGRTAWAAPRPDSLSHRKFGLKPDDK